MTLDEARNILANESIEKSLHEYGRGVAGGAEIYTNVDVWLHERRGARIAARLAAAWSVRMHLEAAAQSSSDPTFIAWAQEQARCLRESSESEKTNAK